MKNIYYTLKDILKGKWTIGLLCLFLGMQACNDAITDEKLLTFEEDVIASFLDANPDFSEFSRVLKANGTMSLLSAYGTYTCFAPTNAAMFEYYEEKNTSFEQLDSATINEIATYHIIAKGKIESVDFVKGSIRLANMADRFLSMDFVGTGERVVTYVNTSPILRVDQKVHNGVIHTIGKVLEPSKIQLPDMVADEGKFYLFNQALLATGLADSLREMDNESYAPVPDGIVSLSTWKTGTRIKTPEYCRRGYTLFMESDSTLLEKANIRSLDDLKLYAASVYNQLFPADAGISDPTDRRNSLNRFVAYHILDRTVDINEFIPESLNEFYVPGTKLREYMETQCPNTMLEVRKVSNKIVINKRSDERNDERNDDGVVIIPMPAGSAKNISQNGIYHEIDRILTYEGVEDHVLNKRLRMDVTSIFSEMATNKVRGDFSDHIFPRFYFKKMAYSESTQVQYIGNRVWSDCQGDEFLFVGKYDFTLETPPLPGGRTYEIRIGYAPNGRRGVAQIYFDDLPCGIPLDMRIMPSDAQISWVEPGTDPSDPDGIENDKMMRNRGYLKAPASMIVASNAKSLRTYSGAIRRVLDTRYFPETKKHTIRVKSVEDLTTREFHLDYLEFVPSAVWENETTD